MTEEDRELRAAFAAERAEERGRTPDFGHPLRRPPTPRHSLLALPALVLAGLLLGVLLLPRLRSGVRQSDLELAREIMSWRAPTDVLLPPPDPALFGPAGRFDESPEGSPLKALDRGGSLEPAPTPRSPGS